MMNASLPSWYQERPNSFAFFVGLYVYVYTYACVRIKKTYALFFSLSLDSLFYRFSYFPKPAFLWHIPLLTLASKSCFILCNRSLFIICSNSLGFFFASCSQQIEPVCASSLETPKREQETESAFWLERENGIEKGITKN